MDPKNRNILPVTRPRADARQSYDRLSGWYDLLVASGERRYREAGLSLLDVGQGEKMLEIGAGTGHCLPRLAECAGHSGMVVGLDISPGMLARASRRIRNCAGYGRIALHVGDAIRLPYLTGFFDAVLIVFTLELFDTSEIPLVLNEGRRVLKPGGRICIVALSREGEPGLMTRVYEWGHMRFPRVLDCRPIYVVDSLRAAGFDLVSATEMPYWGLAVTAALGVSPGFPGAAPGTVP